MTTTNNSSQMYTPEEIQDYLSQLQHQSTMAFIPALVYLCLLIVVGSVGNSLVLVVYYSKMTRTPLRIFIINMAVIDLLTNCFIIPGEIYDMFHIWNFDVPVACRIRLYFNASFVESSAILLVAIAAIRYKIVCRPFEKQATVNQTKLICVILILFTHLTAVPFCVILGSQTIKTPNPQIQTRYCQVDDRYVNTIWPTLNSALFFFLFLAASGLIIIFYACIGYKAWNQTIHLATQNPRCSAVPAADVPDSEMFTLEEKSTSLQMSQSCTESTIESTSQIVDENQESCRQNDNQNLSNANQNIDYKLEGANQNDACNLESDNQNISCKLKSANKKFVHKHRHNLGRTNRMMLTVTIVFFIGFLPFLALNVYLVVDPEQVAALQGVSLAIYQLFLNSYLLNSAANPIVYSLLDRRFRMESVKLFKR